jgi:hypothetical protein
VETRPLDLMRGEVHARRKQLERAQRRRNYTSRPEKAPRRRGKGAQEKRKIRRAAVATERESAAIVASHPQVNGEGSGGAGPVTTGAVPTGGVICFRAPTTHEEDKEGWARDKKNRKTRAAAHRAWLAEEKKRTEEAATAEAELHRRLAELEKLDQMWQEENAVLVLQREATENKLRTTINQLQDELGQSKSRELRQIRQIERMQTEREKQSENTLHRQVRGAHTTVPLWAEIATDTEKQYEHEAIWAIPFAAKMPQLEGGADLVAAICGSIEGNTNFKASGEVRDSSGNGIWRVDYTQPWPKHFVSIKGKPVTPEKKAEWHRAYLRRELRGLVLRGTGEIIARGLHKFFTVGQMPEVKITQLETKQVCEVLEKLDGQMVMGIMVGDVMEMWSRQGHTQVGKKATRIASAALGNYEGLVEHMAGHECTVIFEAIGKGSKVKADEGDDPRLVLIAIRRLREGTYLTHDEMQGLGEAYGVPVVQRITRLEELPFRELVQEVRSWKGREGVVVKFSDGEMVKVKSSWWFTAGFTKERRQTAREWQQNEQMRKEKHQQKLRTRGQRLAILGNRMGWSAMTAFRRWPTARKVEMVYGKEGRLRVTVISFDKDAEREKAQLEAERLGMYAVRAYSNKTRTTGEIRVETFHRVNQ